MGGVWVLPEQSKAIDLIIVGRIEKSDGLDVKLKIGVWDIAGKQWINKTYESNIAKSSYSKRRDLSQDPYQNIFNKIIQDEFEQERIKAEEESEKKENAESRSNRKWMFADWSRKRATTIMQSQHHKIGGI